MSPTCENCQSGDHPECQQRGHNRIVCDCQCATATQARRMIRETTAIPPFLLLDLWMALGGNPGHEFDDQVALKGNADLWSFMLAQVRALNNRNCDQPAVSTDGTLLAWQGENFVRQDTIEDWPREVDGNVKGYDPQDSSTWPKARVGVNDKVDAAPHKVRARQRVEEFTRITRVVMDVGDDDVIEDMQGHVLHVTQRATLTIEGIIR